MAADDTGSQDAGVVRRRFGFGFGFGLVLGSGLGLGLARVRVRVRVRVRGSLIVAPLTLALTLTLTLTSSLWERTFGSSSAIPATATEAEAAATERALEGVRGLEARLCDAFESVDLDHDGEG